MDEHIFKEISNGADITLKQLIEKRNFYGYLDGCKFIKLGKEISYKVSYGSHGKEEFVIARSNDKLVIIEDMILSKFNSLIFHCEKKENLFGAVKELLDAKIKFLPGGLFDNVKFYRIKTSESKYGSIEVSSLFNAFSRLKITRTDLDSWGFFDLFCSKDDDDKKFLRIIESNCPKPKPEPKPKLSNQRNSQTGKEK